MPDSAAMPSPAETGQAVENWPVPCTILNESGASDWVLVCEHASAHVPAEYARLGLGEAERRAHIAWDPGAAELTRALSQRLDATATLANYSRLLIDLNRPIDSPASIPEMSEEIAIPGNIGITALERARRIDRIFTPFHDSVTALLDARAAAGRRTRLLALHSFTPVFRGVARPWHLGVLSGASRPLAERFVTEVTARDATITAALDEPYKVEEGDDMAIPVHGDARGLDALLLEVRNDTLDAPASVEAWAETIAAALERL